MMTPTLALRSGRAELVIGSAGSVRLAGAIAQVAWRILRWDTHVSEAIRAPRIHGETVVHDIDRVLDAVLELRVVLGQRLDRLAKLLGRLLVAGRDLCRAEAHVELLEPGGESVDAIREDVALADVGAIRSREHARVPSNGELQDRGSRQT